MGLCKTAGEVTLKGKKLPLGDTKTVIAAGMSFVPENRRDVGLVLDESVALNICYSQIQTQKRFLKAKWMPGGGLVDRKAASEYAMELIKEFDIRCESPSQLVRHLSGGNQQKICLVRAVSTNPAVLCIAEPTRGVDVSAKENILAMLTKLAKRGMTILLISSELRELCKVCNRIVSINSGRVNAIMPAGTSLETLGLSISGEIN
jgi:simple sugar transport system ATP-binding protein